MTRAVDTGLRSGALLLIAAAASACHPGDHARTGGLARLFGGGAAGKDTNEPAATDTTGPADSITSDARPAAGGGGARAPNPSNARAGRSAPPLAGQLAQSGAGSTGGRVAVAMNGGTPTSGAAAPEAPSSQQAGASGAPDTPATCAAGYIAAGDQCACDLSGTFALHATIPVTMASMAPLEALSDVMDLWGLARLDYDAAGDLGIALSVCGQTTPDICAAAQAPVIPSPEAYAQYIPVEVWDKPSNAPAEVRLNLPAAQPGSALVTPALNELFGISLSDPAGAWPTTRKDIAGGSDFDGSAVNGAQWVDMDGDTNPGLTVRIVAPGGVTSSSTSGPPRMYGATSSQCPRSNAQAARSPYAFLPLPQGLGVKRIKALYSAQRMRFELHGALESCDRISGSLTGPGEGKLKLDAVIGGCSMVNGSGEAQCGAGLLDSASSGAGGGATSILALSSGEFTLVRTPDATSCSEVRAANER